MRRISDQTAGVLTIKDVRRVWEYIGKTPNWWMEVPAFEPEQIARLYAHDARGGVGGLFPDEASAQRGRLGAVPDAVVDRAVRVLSAGRVDGAGLAGRNRERATARSAHRRSDDQLRRGGERLDGQSGVDAAIARLGCAGPRHQPRHRRRAQARPKRSRCWSVSTKCSRRSAVASFGSSTGSRRQAAPRRCRKTRGRSDRFRRSSTQKSLALRSRPSDLVVARLSSKSTRAGCGGTAAWRRSASADRRCQLKSAVWRSSGMRPSTRASSINGVDRAIVHARGERAERQAGADLGAEPAAPFGSRSARSRDSRGRRRAARRRASRRRCWPLIRL